MGQPVVILIGWLCYISCAGCARRLFSLLVVLYIFSSSRCIGPSMVPNICSLAPCQRWVTSGHPGLEILVEAYTWLQVELANTPPGLEGQGSGMRVAGTGTEEQDMRGLNRHCTGY